MGDVGDDYRAWDEHKKAKKAANHVNSIDILKKEGVEFKQLNPDHYRVGPYDYWPSTGLFIHLKTKKRGRGVFNLIGKVKTKGPDDSGPKFDNAG